MAIGKVGVVGAGMMGSEIALVFALAGKDVLLVDNGQEQVDRALSNITRVLDSGIGRNFYTEEDKSRALASIRTTTDLGEYGDRDLIIEGVSHSLLAFMWNRPGLPAGPVRGSCGSGPSVKKFVGGKGEELDEFRGQGDLLEDPSGLFEGQLGKCLAA